MYKNRLCCALQDQAINSGKAFITGLSAFLTRSHQAVPDNNPFSHPPQTMKSTTKASSLLLLAHYTSLIAGHATFQQAWAGSKDYGTTCVRMPVSKQTSSVPNKS
ncbi:hypothetical protein V8F06_006981 [Rhypophila decipiens]